MRYTDFCETVTRAFRQDCQDNGKPHMRFGQHYYNLLPSGIRLQIVDTPLDPFMFDEVSYATHAFVAEAWDNMEDLSVPL